jgi:hypothetical protein
MRFTILLVGGLGLVACAEETWSLRTRSAADLQCPAEEVKIYKLDERAYYAMGCQQAATYIEVCDAPEGSLTRKCTWSMDSARSAPAATQPPAKPATVAGCSFDAQCKGDRVCVKRECVAPPHTAESPEPASSSDPPR